MAVAADTVVVEAEVAAVEVVMVHADPVGPAEIRAGNVFEPALCRIE